MNPTEPLDRTARPHASCPSPHICSGLVQFGPILSALHCLSAQHAPHPPCKMRALLHCTGSWWQLHLSYCRLVACRTPVVDAIVSQVTGRSLHPVRVAEANDMSCNSSALAGGKRAQGSRGNVQACAGRIKIVKKVPYSLAAPLKPTLQAWAWGWHRRRCNICRGGGHATGG